MDAVIMAAGLGTRLRPLTLQKPKPLLDIQGRPILDWLLGALPGSVNRILVVVHYLADQIENYLQRQQWIQHWAVVFQDQPRGTGDALRSCRARIESDRFLVLNGDDLFGADDLRRLAETSAGVLVHEVQEPRQFGIVMLRSDGSLDRLIEKPNLPGPRLANCGAYVFPRSVFDTTLERSARGEYEITDYLTGLARAQPVEVVSAKFWIAVSNPAVLDQVQVMDLSPMLQGAKA
jgi:bifunctional UDP-N-acetylglucosamine pyrophosphorylase/glucosamine-1-phosphate N-acetyltransferase